ncbi:MAG: hypothetical protein KIT31_21545, partial [Deltaproteobacteria bacterium]|nr:hypothetical protein [Deltaproteobacteria bacterium]
MAKLVAVSWNGRFVASCAGAGAAIEIADLQGVTPPRRVAEAGDFAFAGGALWIAREGGIERVPVDGAPATTIAVAEANLRELRAADGEGAATAVLCDGERALWLEDGRA